MQGASIADLAVGGHIDRAGFRLHPEVPRLKGFQFMVSQTLSVRTAISGGIAVLLITPRVLSLALFGALRRGPYVLITVCEGLG